MTRVIGATTVNTAVAASDSLPPSDMAAWRDHLSGQFGCRKRNGNRKTIDRDLKIGCYT